MNHNPEVSEYGLVIDDRDLRADIRCQGCGGHLCPFPAKDWLYCPKCHQGASRLELADSSWVLSRTRSDKQIFQRYHETYVLRIQKARSLWSKLEAGTALDQQWTYGSKLSRYLRLLTTQEELEAVRDISFTPVRNVSLPCLVLRLEDLPGRITGFALLSGPQEPEVARFSAGPKIAFLQELDTPMVMMPDILKVLKLQSYNMMARGDYLPLGFADIRETNWWPCVTSGYLYSPDVLTHHDLLAVARANCRVYLTEKLPQKLEPNVLNSRSFCARAVSRAVGWDLGVAQILSSYTPQDAAKLLLNANLSSQSLKSILQHLPDGKRRDLENAIAARPLVYRLSSNRVVLDDGTSWKTHDGKMILSGSLRILRVVKEPEVLYSCQFVTPNRSLFFTAGKEFERDSFKVLLRECLIQNMPIVYDRAYTRVAIEIAACLRPPGSEPDEKNEQPR